MVDVVSARKCDSLIESKEDYEFYIEADRIALSIDSKREGLKERTRRYFFADVWKFERLLRKTEYIQNCKNSGPWKAYYYYLLYKLHGWQLKLGFDIYTNCFGPGLSISHPGTINVHSAAKIGANCRIHPCVVIGTQAGFGARCPKIGNNVFIGPGAKIFGEITIADGIAIGANSVVDKSFYEPNISIAGIPAKKISSKGSRGLLVDAVEILRKTSKRGLAAAY